MDPSIPRFGYWNIRGLGQHIRLVFDYLGVKINYVKHENKEWFEETKYSLGLDLPNLPYLIDGDVKMTESNGIMRFIAEKYKPELLGADVKAQA